MTDIPGDRTFDYVPCWLVATAEAVWGTWEGIIPVPAAGLFREPGLRPLLKDPREHILNQEETYAPEALNTVNRGLADVKIYDLSSAKINIWKH